MSHARGHGDDARRLDPTRKRLVSPVCPTAGLMGRIGN